MARKGADFLAGVPLFGGLSKRHLRKIAQLTEEVRFEPGATIAEEGEAGDTFYVITQGRARVKRRNRTVARLGGGDFFGEISLLDGGPRSASVQTETAMTALALDRKEFRSVLESEPQVTLKVLREVATRLRQAERPLAG